MAEIIELPTSAARVSASRVGAHLPFQTDVVYVVFTGVEDTMAAVRVGQEFAESLDAALMLIHFRLVPYSVPIDAPTGVSPLETESFVGCLRAQGHDVQVGVCVCRDERRAIRSALKPHSLVVVGGQPRLWPTRSDRLRRLLTEAGHVVVCATEAVAASTHARSHPSNRPLTVVK